MTDKEPISATIKVPLHKSPTTHFEPGRFLKGCIEYSTREVKEELGKLGLQLIGDPRIEMKSFADDGIVLTWEVGSIPKDLLAKKEA